MQDVNIIGEWFGPGTGYNNHVKQLAKALDKEGINVSVQCNRPNGWHHLCPDDEFKILKRNPEEADVNICIGLPTIWPLYMCERKDFIGYFVWEGDRCSKEWINIMMDERVKQVWVPSEHTKESIWHTIQKHTEFDKHFKTIIDKIKVVPHGVDLSLFYSQQKQLVDKVPEHPSATGTQNVSGHESEQKHTSVGKLKFITNGGWTAKGWKDRKGISYLVKAYLEEFTSKDDVEMTVKVNMAYGTDVDKNLLELDVQNKDNAPLNLVTSTIPYEQLVDFYNEGDVFVNTSMAEGFHLGCLEAMACGKPVVTTTFGGMTDFVNEDNGWYLKEGEMIDSYEGGIYEGVKWKKPVIDEIRRVLRGIYDGYKADNKEITNKSKLCLEKVKEYTWQETAKKAATCLQEI